MNTTHVSIVRPETAVGKLWGEEWWLTNTENYCAKVLILEPGFQCSLHYHPRKIEDFIVLSGIVRLEQRDVRGLPIDEMLLIGDKRTIQAKTPHRFSSRLGATILEISTHHDDSDTVRIEDSRKI